jgi:transposase-like protein
MGSDSHPVAGQDYPRTWQEFSAWFPDEGACRLYLEKLRWPDAFSCPGCGQAPGWRSKRGLWICGSCQRQTSATAGTIFADTRSPLRTWFAAAWYVTGQKQGVSALGLQHVLGLGSYETAWSWLHKLRRAMVRPGRDQLFGDIEIDETYVGGPEPWAFGRRNTSKSIVAIAVERRGRTRLGRVRMARVPKLTMAAMTDFVSGAVERGSVVRTDGLSSYRGLTAAGYTHQAITLTAGDEPAHVAMPAVHRVSSLLQRWLLGTHQGAVRAQHLDYYLDEFTFRFNRRSARHRGLLFYRLLQQAVNTGQVTLDQLIGGKHHNTLGSLE